MKTTVKLILGAILAVILAILITFFAPFLVKYFYPLLIIIIVTVFLVVRHNRLHPKNPPTENSTMWQDIKEKDNNKAAE